jgi:NAD(P)-dependent dehydrogenase (short-subunit alcohol dehydrogenase family)
MSEPTSILHGRNVLVTGASGGLGRAIALELASCGCRLFLTGRDRQRLAETKSLVRDVAPVVHASVTDLADGQAVADLAGRAIEIMGRVDILVNCAGIFPVAALEESTAEDFVRCFAVNVRAPFLLTQRLAIPMAERGWGRVVNIGSSSAYSGFRDTALYCASKHALLGLSRALFQELKDRGVRIYCLSPGSIQTDMGRKVRGQTFETFIRPEEVARYLSFVVSFDAEVVSDEVRLNRVTIQ